MKLKVLSLLFFAIGCSTATPRVLQDKNPSFFEEIIGEWIILKGNGQSIDQPEIEEIARLTFNEEGSMFFNVTNIESIELDAFSSWKDCKKLVWTPALTNSGTLAKRTFTIFCEGTDFEDLLFIDDKFVSKIIEIKRAELTKRNEKFFFIKNTEKNAVSLISRIQRQEKIAYKEDYEDLATLDNLSIDFSKYNLPDGNTELQRNERERQIGIILSDHLKKMKGKQITLNLVKLEGLEEEIELNVKGKALKGKINDLAAKVIFGMATTSDKLNLGSYSTQLRECKDCHTGQVFYKGKLEISEENFKTKEKKYQIIKIYKNFSKKEALALNEGQKVRIKGKVSNLLFENSYGNLVQLYRIYLD